MADDGGDSLRLELPQHDETEVGNYFVSNYPPFSLWTPQQVGELEAQLDSPAGADRPLGMYVHIPFCRKRCHFCYFRVYTDQNSKAIGAYLDAVIEEAAMMGRRAYVAGRPLQFVYFGGGTPSYLSVKQLAYLLDGLKRALPWEQVKEVAFECEPGTLNENKLNAIAELGVTRLSLGIENFSDEVLKLNNRAHESKEVFRAYEWARSAGFEQINIDLIAGMLGETEANWSACIDQALRLRADVVTIYQMEVPYNTTIYQQMKAAGEIEAPVADWSTKRRWVSEAFDALEGAGYSIGSAYTAVKDAAASRFVYRDALWSGSDMLGVGVSSFGLLGGVHYQNQHDIVPYVSAAAGGESPVYRAMRMSDEDQLVRRFVLQMKLGRISRRPFMEAFGVDIFERWRDVLEGYARDGLLTIDGDELRLTRDGLLQADRLLHAFFEPQHRGVRYA